MIIKQILFLILFYYFLIMYTLLLGVPALLLNNNKIINIVKKFGQDLSIYIINNLNIKLFLAETEQEIQFTNPDLIDVIVANHKSSIDFIILISLLKYLKIYNYNFVLKKDITLIPGLGFIMYTNDDITINRNWETDQDNINNQLNDLMKNDDNKKKVIIIFPEGTRYNNTKLIESQKFATENNYEPYNYLLFPKTKGLWFIINTLSNQNKLGKIWDLTIIYPNSIKNSLYLTDLTNKLLNSINFIIKEIKLPNNYQDKDIFKKWFLDIWKTKDDIIKNNKNIIYKKININYDLQSIKIINIINTIGFILLFNNNGRIYLLISLILSYILMI